jgi:broad specificity phosphatase PhoE
MKLIFMRHGEATHNVKEIISDKSIYDSRLTNHGINQVRQSIKKLDGKIDTIYVSPLPRTIETANLVAKNFPDSRIAIDDRIREIDYGKYSGQSNNSDLDKTRQKQIGGDYFVRFGGSGENKYDIESRVCNFLEECRHDNSSNSTILIISHGIIISFIKRLINAPRGHIPTGNVEEFLWNDDAGLRQSQKILERIKKQIT